jgi:hypothetical protein
MKRLTLIICLVFLIFTSLNKIYCFEIQAANLENMTPYPKPTIIYVLPYPGILPDHPLYFLKNIRDKIVILSKRNQIQKSQIFLLLADKNLVMGRQLLEKGDFELSIKSFQMSQNYILNAVDSLKKVEVSVIPPGVVDKMKLAIAKHEEVMKNISENETNRNYIVRLHEVAIITNQAKKELSTIK